MFAGEIISTKRDELDSMMTMMNIQIDNPISVLNQDVSRTFLVTSKPDEKYSLFMKATLLDTIEDNYKEALNICEEEYKKLKHYSMVCTLYLFYLILFYMIILIFSYVLDLIASKGRDTKIERKYT